jgi:hypothetical protein
MPHNVQPRSAGIRSHYSGRELSGIGVIEVHVDEDRGDLKLPRAGLVIMGDYAGAAISDKQIRVARVRRGMEAHPNRNRSIGLPQV